MAEEVEEGVVEVVAGHLLRNQLELRHYRWIERHHREVEAEEEVVGVGEVAVVVVVEEELHPLSEQMIADFGLLDRVVAEEVKVVVSFGPFAVPYY